MKNRDSLFRKQNYLYKRHQDKWQFLLGKSNLEIQFNK